MKIIIPTNGLRRINEALNIPEQITMDDFYIKDGRCDEVEVLGNIYEDEEEIKRGASK